MFHKPECLYFLLDLVKSIPLSKLLPTHGTVVEQVVRPTGLLDPEIEVRPTEYQIDNLMNEIVDRIDKQERTLVVTLTKRMAEELNR